ncbi:PKD domain-containing protein, partial [Candidatus Woesearchaeota archaeon]|nr:PKD domain-containing protein [Candidatus Woesearchaeota archaeon]
MGRKNILTIFVVALLVAALFPANAIALPDVPPSCSLRSNTDHTDTTAILTAVSVDTLGNAGVDNIELLEGGAHMSSKDCYDAGTCVYTRTVVRTTEGWRTYQAVCTDRAGNEARSGEVRVFFEGTNSPPVIDSASPASPFTMEESETQRFEVYAHDPDLDPLTYEWRVDGSTVAGPGTRDYYYFSEDVTGSDTFTVSVYVRDPAGALAVHAWTVHVTEVVGEVTVSITEDYRTECQIFSFTAHPDTPDPVDHYEWDFGDGLATTSAGTSVTHQFRDDGTYTVRVTAVEADGDRFTGSTTAHVEDVDPYSVVATCETPVIAEGETAHFAGSGSASCAADPISSYAWNFGDGHSDSGAALRTPSHTYTASGTYTVTLSVHDEDSFTTATCIQRVTDSDPVASFTWDPARPVAGDVISFTDTSVSYDGIVSWEWDIYCDGVIESRIRNPSTPAPVPGSYDICLTVREADGDSDMARETVVVSDGSADTTPVADLVAVPASGDAPLRVHFECSATGGEVPLRYVINFGDGTPPAISGSVDHTYAVPGDYTATCRVTDVDGDSDSDSEMIRVTDGTIDTVPVVELVATPTSGDDPLDVHFECLVTDGNAPFAYSIDFGDGTPFAIGSVVDHTYAAPGDYTATCRVWDVDGDSDRDSEVITVRDSSVDTVPVVDLVATPSGGASPLDVHFDCLVTDGNAPFIFFMEFGDGTPLAIGDSFDHTYAVDGDYTATCRVWDREGDFDMDSELITVGSDLAPVVELVATPTSGNEILDVHFECVWVGGSEPVDYRIDFGDRYAPVDASVADHSYDPIYVDFFTYDAICHAWDADGDVGRDTEFITVFNNEPLVELLATPDSGDSPLDVHFECVASGGDAPYRFNIDTGDGYISRGATLDYTYAADGTYTASCAVRDTDGDTVLADHVITVSVPGDEIPVARMRVAPTSGDEPLDVDVLCAGSGGDGALTYMIDWGDGTRDFAELASHTYTSDGRYRVSCRVTDEDGDSDVVSEGILVFDVSAALDAEFTWSPLSPGVLEDVLFDATIVSSDPITRIVWDFDDGTRSFVEDPTHAFAAAGSYDVILSVWDAGGHFDSVSHTITLSADPTDPPVASLTVDPVSGTEPLTVEAACTGTDGDAPLGYVIDWGDGSVPFAGSRAMHTYDDDGLYDVVCTVTDADGESAADTVTVDVADTVPTLSFDWTPESPDELESVFFDADVSAYDGIDSVEWDFGDGEFDTSGDLSPVHEYADAGSYDVTVTVTDGDGSVVSATDTIHVAIDAPTARLLADPSSGTEPLTVDFVCAATGGNAPYTYEIDFGDGTAPEASNTATHTYDQDGVYLATCTVTDNDGDADTDSADVEVLDTVPSVFFTYLPADPVEFEEVYFFGEVSGYDEPVTWEWDFGDGATSTDLEPVHAFDAPGVYTVTLSATDADGSTEWHSEDVTVGDDAPVAILLADPMTGPEGLEVTFNCTVVGGTEPFTYVVDYGTGDSTTDADSTYVYSAPGTYTATCEVTDFDSDVSTSAPVSIVIDDNAPVVDLIVSLADPAAPGWEGDMYDFECVITGG